MITPDDLLLASTEDTACVAVLTPQRRRAEAWAIRGVGLRFNVLSDSGWGCDAGLDLTCAEPGECWCCADGLTPADVRHMLQLLGNLIDWAWLGAPGTRAVTHSLSHLGLVPTHVTDYPS
ncbi:MAG: hypothetical protein GC157_04625 [Frankiales bacterium]|nr:hypothetical protein [Frankiales bacterium]